MKLQTRYVIPILVSMLVTFCTMVAQTGEANYVTDRNPKTPFRYVIVNGVSEIEQFVNENPQAHSFEVLMEDRAFNEKNLKTLFKLLSTRFSRKGGFSASVYTSMYAIFTPEERDSQSMLQHVSDLKRFKHAYLVRNGYGEYFYYSIPGRIKEKRVIISKPKKSPEVGGQ